MVPIKALLTGLTGASLCVANISGIVTDTGSTPIAGAMVMLEKGGQTVLSGADGRFTIDPQAAILPGAGNVSSNGMFARISRNAMTVTLAERSAVEVATFNLGGKALSTLRKTLGAGVHSISLPDRGAGVYLYKVKSGGREFVLKGNSVDGVLSGNVSSSMMASSDHQAKQALATAYMIDVIAAKKTGYLNFRSVQNNDSATGVAIKMIANAGDMMDTEGNVYQTVKIGNQVWMAENLRTTKYNDGTAIPTVSAEETWFDATTPKYCFYNNTINPDSIKKFGALYNWYVISPTNPKRIAPTGWHVPTNAEWDTLETFLIAKGYNWDATTMGDKTAKSLATKTDWKKWTEHSGKIGNDLTKNNSTGFSALPGGRRSRYGFENNGQSGDWWSSTEQGLLAFYSSLNYGAEDRTTYSVPKSHGFSVRLVKD